MSLTICVYDEIFIAPLTGIVVLQLDLQGV